MDDTAIAVTRAAFDLSNFWSGWSTVIVAVGVFIEFVVLFVFSKEMDRREKVVVAAASALIVIGVVGEYWFGKKATDAAEALQVDATTKAANATGDAASAKERAATLKKQTSQLQADAANAQKHAAADRFAEEQLKALVSWRVPTHDQEVLLADKLGHSAGGKITLGYLSDDSETRFLAVQLSHVFDMANTMAGKQIWQVSALPRTYEPNFLVGIYVNGPDMIIAAVVGDAFTAAKIPFSTRDLGTPPPMHMGFMGGDQRTVGEGVYNDRRKTASSLSAQKGLKYIIPRPSGCPLGKEWQG